MRQRVQGFVLGVLVASVVSLGAQARVIELRTPGYYTVRRIVDSTADARRAYAAGVSDTLATIGWLRRQGSIEAADKRLLAAERCLRGKPIDLVRTYSENTWRTTDKTSENAAIVLLAEIACQETTTRK